MKKAILALCVLLIVSPLSFSAQQPVSNNNNSERSFYQSLKSGWNSFLDALAGKSSRRHPQNKATVVTVPNNPPSNNQTSHNDASLYNSFVSGWNSFIDFLTGTTSRKH